MRSAFFRSLVIVIIFVDRAHFFSHTFKQYARSNMKWNVEYSIIFSRCAIMNHDFK